MVAAPHHAFFYSSKKSIPLVEKHFESGSRAASLGRESYADVGWDQLPWIHDVVGIQRGLYPFHRPQ